MQVIRYSSREQPASAAIRSYTLPHLDRIDGIAVAKIQRAETPLVWEISRNAESLACPIIDRKRYKMETVSVCWRILSTDT